MNPNDFALVRFADTGSDGMLNLLFVDRKDPDRRVVIVYDHASGEFFDSVIKTGRRVAQLDGLDAARLLATALSRVAGTVA